MIPTASLQMLWALTFAGGLFFLLKSPQSFLKRGKIDRAADISGRLRGQTRDSEFHTDKMLTNFYTLKHENEFYKKQLSQAQGKVVVLAEALHRAFSVLWDYNERMAEWTGFVRRSEKTVEKKDLDN